jgi:hypothetical protein
MKLYRTPVALFLLAASLPFVVSFAFFVISQRHSLLTEPEAYIASLKRTGHAFHMISLSTWKYFLAHDPLCHEAEAVVIGSSRVREIDDTVVGTSVCNLYIDGLNAPGFAALAQELPPTAPEPQRVVYVSIDHFWFWGGWPGPFDGLELKLLAESRTLWRVRAVLRALSFFTISDFLEAMRRYRQGNVHAEHQTNNVWYPDGHLFHPQYYTQKHAGIHRSFSRQAIETSVHVLFGQGRLSKVSLQALETGVRLLHTKGYVVRVFWTPVPPTHIASASRHFPDLFQQTIDTVDQLAATLPLDCYVPASQILDASRFGCTERDYFDTTHIDVECMHRVFATVFRNSQAP